PQRFHRAALDTGLPAVPLTPAFGERVVLDAAVTPGERA
ncbi:MAG: hypothetical protein JWN84_3158, partial [Nocardioides sp.]|nr:hypothetical protein [Nocardioides sp.]